MPIYEYLCPDCSTRFEKLLSLSRMHEQPPCPNCAGGNAHKLLSTIARVRVGNGSAPDFGASATSSGGGCAGCSGGSCATCH